MDIIHLLPDSVANQIAAGEVIQRPASVVKELVENSIDAGATLIKVIIKGAGRTSILVIDDGKGMSPTDARLAFERHATSKIQQSADLFALTTMGFRGEALASIAAVAQVELRTRRNCDELGTFIEIEGSQVVRQEVEQCAVGTQFLIKNLFFNVPARRKFLKSDETEMRNILQEMSRIVLAHPDIAFQLYNGDDLVYDLPVASFKQRIVALCGRKVRNISQQLVDVDVNTMLVKISGYVGTPQSAGRNPQQFFFVNGRYMNHPYFRRAVLQAYERMISAEDAPQFFLNLEVDPSTIDVNIHPTKTEIKFENEREIWSILSIAVKEALGKFNVAPSIDFDTTDSIDIPVATKTDGAIPEMPKVTFNPNYNPFQSNGSSSNNYTSQSHLTPRNWKDLFEGSRPTAQTVQSQMDYNTSDMFEEDMKNGSSIHSSLLTPHSSFSEDSFLYKNRYLCVPMKSGLMFIDVQRAITRICYDNLLSQVERSTGVSQKLLFPEVLELSLEDKCLFTEIEMELRAVGFEIAEFGKSMYRIEGIPALLSEGVDTIKILETIIEEVKSSGVGVSDSIHRIIANIISQNEATIRIKRNISPEERNSLIAQLFASSNPNNTPDGRKIINTLTDDVIDSMF
ncbi:MAG: DNA mismatch repair endonuclease MutL [Paludibacteraceae bacterium]|nr:DNA mismatch repair endonuclease MutL [Paludibacteraceae bacterium]